MGDSEDKSNSSWQSKTTLEKKIGSPADISRLLIRNLAKNKIIHCQI